MEANNDNFWIDWGSVWSDLGGNSQYYWRTFPSVDQDRIGSNDPGFSGMDLVLPGWIFRFAGTNDIPRNWFVVLFDSDCHPTEKLDR